MKIEGHLYFPFRNVVATCLTCEKKFREMVLLSSDHPYEKLSTNVCHNTVSQILSDFQEKTVFPCLTNHFSDSDAINNNVVVVMKAVAETYLQVRYRYAARQFTARHASLKGIQNRTNQ